MKRTRWAGLAMASVLTVLLAACTNAGAVETGTPAVATAAAPVAAATPGPSAAPDVFTGTERCQTRPAPSGTDADTGHSTCDRTTNGPRINGSMDVWWTAVGGDGPVSATGHGTLANDGGSWECTEASGGPGAPVLSWRDQVCLGHGGYVGLTACVHLLSSTDSFTYGVIGSIEKTP
jgi:hypothetical protein